MRYLGIDPGTTRIGYGIIDDIRGTLTPVVWGIISNPGTHASLDKQSTVQELKELIRAHKPHAAGVERLFFMNNQKTAMPVAEMRGVIMLTLADAGLPIHEFTPLQVKQMVCGHGGAKKDQIQKMVQLILHITERIHPDDAADALAIALCCSSVQTKY